jgi:hypothetical protein
MALLLLSADLLHLTEVLIGILVRLNARERGRERDHLEDPGVDGRTILRRIFRKSDVGLWTGSKWLRIGTGGGNW